MPFSRKMNLKVERFGARNYVASVKFINQSTACEGSAETARAAAVKAFQNMAREFEADGIHANMFSSIEEPLV